MKLPLSVLLGSTMWMTCVTQAADASPKDQLTEAAKALAAKSSYSWKTTVVVPEDAQFKPGPTEGKTEKDGFMLVSSSFGPTTSQTVKKGDKIALTNRDGAWESIAEVEANTEGFGRFRGAMARNLQTPADQAVELVADVKELKKEGDMYSGELSEEAAKALVSFRGRRGGGDGPNIPFAKASAKFWVADGVLSKMEIKVDGSMEFNGNEMEIVRTSTTVISDVGTTEVKIPEGAAAKLK